MDKKKQASGGEGGREASARASLLCWHGKAGRHALPWRGSHDPYAVLVSEFMLQQTTVAAVIPRFTAWMDRFPYIAALAAADEQEVLSAWEGLGYYARARRLHAAAKAVVERHAGFLPAGEKELLALPGIGAYTAAAIRAFAHDQQAVVLDTNIIRVMARWNDLHEPVDTAVGRKTIGRQAGVFFPDTGCRTVASALMDLGATLCTAGRPDCPACPLRPTCLTKAPGKLPVKSPRRVTTAVTENRAWILRDGKLHLLQSPGPRWKGLWILPELGETAPSGRKLAELIYPITRYRVTMRIYPAQNIPGKGAGKDFRGFTREEIQGLPIPSPHRKAIEKAFRAIAA